MQLIAPALIKYSGDELIEAIKNTEEYFESNINIYLYSLVKKLFYF